MGKLSRKHLVLAALGLLLIGFICGVIVQESGALGMTRKRIMALFSVEEAPPAEYRQPQLPAELVAGMRQMGFNPQQIQTAEQFREWQSNLVAEAERLLTVDWCCHEQQAIYEEEAREIGYAQQRGVLQSPDDEMDIVFYRLVPSGAELAGKGRNPAVLVIPGSGIGVAGTLAGGDYQSAIAAKLARAGYIVYAVENLGWGERAIDPGTQFYFTPSDSLGINSIMLGRPLAARYVSDARRVLSVMLQDALVDPRNIGVVGCSLGGRIAMFVSLLEPDAIHATVVASGLRAEPDNPAPGQFIIPGMLMRFDSVDAAAAIAPRPLLLTYGAEDEHYGDEYENSTSFNRLMPAWEVMGQAENLQQVLHPLGHTYDVGATIDFFDRCLKGQE
jgi:dienelactone hydrolase